VLAAARAGVHTILLPKDNAGDIQDELPAEIMASLDLKLVGTVDEALRLVFPEPGA